MESVAIVESSNIIGSKDKGISIGENSNILIHNSIFEEKRQVARSQSDTTHTPLPYHQVAQASYALVY